MGKKKKGSRTTVNRKAGEDSGPFFFATFFLQNPRSAACCIAF